MKPLNSRTWSMVFVVVLSAGEFAGAQSNVAIVGLAPEGQIAFEYVGMVIQNDLDFETFGYLTQLPGVEDDVLFFDTENRNEANARLTFHSKAKMTGRSIVAKVFNISAAGEMTIYARNEP